MATNEQLEQRILTLEQKLTWNILDDSPYQSAHTGQDIDDAVTRALPGGAIDVDLGGKAPAGYGLGGSSPYVDDFNTAGANGWYSGTGSTVNGPDKINYNGYGAVHVLRGGSTIVHQDYFMYDSDKFSGEMLATRASSNCGNTWTPWEYVNPPMVIGVEYRTIERYLGKPVYVKLVDFGALPNTASKYVDPNISNFEKLIEPMTVTIIGSDGSVHDSPLLDDTKIIARSWFKMESGGIAIKTMADRSTDSAVVKLKYTKTTD